MKKILSLFAAAAVSVAAFADSPAIHGVQVDVTLMPDGCAKVVECWDVHVTSGTEWYLVKDNLGDIRIKDFTVLGENDNLFTNVGEWNTGWSLKEKANRCGMVHKSDGGVELCWGVGSMGDHWFLVSYIMTNAVKSLNDYDMFHMQLISPGLSSKPEFVRASVRKFGGALCDTTNTRVWGFGFEGTVDFEGGAAVYESIEQFQRNSSLIALLRFDKGYFHSSSIQERDFQEALDIAMEGADFGESYDSGSSGDDGVWPIIAFIAAFVAIIFGGRGAVRRNRKKILGKQPDEIGWCRNVPFEGDVLSSEYVLKRLGEDGKSNSLAGALILRMIYNGQLSVRKDASEKVEISFSDRGKESLDPVSLGLYNLMLQASGDDRILQNKEFSKWSRKHTDEVNAWVESVSDEGLSRISAKGWADAAGKFNEGGQAKACEVIGFRKYLKEFTLVDEREASEVSLWRDYLVFASLYGIADRVAAQLKDINPQLFEQTMACDYPTMNSVILMSRNLGNSITSAQEAKAAAAQSSRAGTGGFSSFGGGGGFSGGGFGGGSR